MRIFFSVGEPSGDEHAAGLIRELRARCPDVVVTGFGGPRMQPLIEESGGELVYPLTELAVMGFTRVVPMLGRFYRLVKRAEAIFSNNPPDAVVLVDFPGFNWWIARKARAAGIPVFYYLPPQLWAWAPWRIKKIRRYVDHILCGLPFEYDWYTRRGVSAEYVGHPFFDEVAERSLDDVFLASCRNRPGPTVAVLPEAEEIDVEIDPSDLRVDTYRAQGAGGQHVNKTDSAIRITHLPTGIVVQCQDNKSQHKNRAKAMKVLRARMYDVERQKIDGQRAADRKEQVGRGDRSERIRTYNFPQGRVTDHRINLTLYKLDKMMSGEVVDEVVDALIADQQASLLADLEAHG